MKTPQDGWLGLMVRVGQESKSDEEYDARLANELMAHEADERVVALVWPYDWKSAKRAAFCSPDIRMMVERSLLRRT